jgi:hypothetical protein
MAIFNDVWIFAMVAFCAYNLNVIYRRQRQVEASWV